MSETVEDLGGGGGAGAVGDVINTLNLKSEDEKTEYIPVFPAAYSVFDAVANPKLAAKAAQISNYSTGSIYLPTLYGSYGGWRGDSSISGAVILANNDADGSTAQFVYKDNTSGTMALIDSYNTSYNGQKLCCGISPGGVYGGYITRRSGTNDGSLHITSDTFATLVDHNVSGIDVQSLYDIAFNDNGKNVLVFYDPNTSETRVAYNGGTNGVFTLASGIDWTDISANSAVQPSTESADTFYVTGKTKLWKTTDGGANFVASATLPTVKGTLLANVSKDGSTILAVAAESPKELAQAHVSKDGGATWKDISRTFSSAEINYSRDNAADGSSILYVSVAPSGNMGVAWCKGSQDNFIIPFNLAADSEGIGEWIVLGSSQWTVYQSQGAIADDGQILALYQGANGVPTSAPTAAGKKLNTFQAAIPPAEIAGFPKVIGG